jgi:hypothetical protein
MSNCMNFKKNYFSANINSEHDSWSYSSGPKFSTKKFYNLLIGVHPTPKPNPDIWKNMQQPKAKIL